MKICKNGHPQIPENIRYYEGGAHRKCHACDRARHRVNRLNDALLLCLKMASESAGVHQMETELYKAVVGILRDGDLR